MPRSFPCPQFINPTDHFLSVLRDGKAADAVVAAYAASMPALGSPSAISSGKAAGKAAGTPSCDVEAGLAGEEPALEGSSDSAASLASEAAALVEAERPCVPFVYQASVLSVRMMRNWGRNPMMLAAEAVQVGGLPGFLGLDAGECEREERTCLAAHARCDWLGSESAGAGSRAANHDLPACLLHSRAHAAVPTTRMAALNRTLDSLLTCQARLPSRPPAPVPVPGNLCGPCVLAVRLVQPFGRGGVPAAAVRACRNVLSAVDQPAGSSCLTLDACLRPFNPCRPSDSVNQPSLISA